ANRTSGSSSAPNWILRFSAQSELGVNERSKCTFVSSSRILIASMSSQLAPAVGRVPPETFSVTVSSTIGNPSSLKFSAASSEWLLLSLSLSSLEQPMIITATSIIKIVKKKRLFLINIFLYSLLLFRANNHFRINEIKDRLVIMNEFDIFVRFVFISNQLQRYLGSCIPFVNLKSLAPLKF